MLLGIDRSHKGKFHTEVTQQPQSHTDSGGQGESFEPEDEDNRTKVFGVSEAQYLYGQVIDH